MKIYNRTDAKRITPQSLSEKFDNEEDRGISYNWILANYYSLRNYIKTSKMSIDAQWSKNVMCTPVIIESNSTVVSAKNKFEKLNASTIQFIKGNSAIDYHFVHGVPCSVPLIVLSHFAFSMHKSLILDTRIYDEDSPTTSSASLMKSMQGRSTTLVDGDIESQIDNCLMCKSAVFLMPECNADGSAVKWYIPLADDEYTNRMNAKAQYNETHGETKVLGNSLLSPDEISRIIEKSKKKNGVQVG